MAEEAAPYSTGRTAGGRLAPALAAGGMLAVLGAQLALVLRANGVFTYALDDPYIHLALAEEIARGHYGVSPGEAASPSSSILWPFLLAPFARLAWGVWVPLVLNVVCAVGAAAVFARVAEGPLATMRGGRLLAGVAGVAMGLVVNLHVLVAIGMEHSAAVLMAALVALGMLREAEGRGVAWWLVAALVLGPLLRYEGLALTVPALVYLWRRGHRRTALGVGAAVVGVLGGFSLFLMSLGLPPLPSSVLAKLPATRMGGPLTGPIIGFAANLSHERGRWLLLAVAVLLAVALAPRGGYRPRAERGLALWGAAALLLHLLVGDVGWLDRYEAYAWAAALVLLVGLFRAPLARLAAERPPVRFFGLGVALFVVLGVDVLMNVPVVPGGAGDVRLQQCEMGRFLTDYWRAPVGVTDLGCVAYRNDYPVLDLWGLASIDALRARRAGTPPDWPERLAAAHDVRLLMLYPGVPTEPDPRWIPLGDLDLGRPLYVVGGNPVRFFARDEATAARALPLLAAWAQGLPASATFTPVAGLRPN